MTDQEKIARFYLPCIKNGILHALFLVRSGEKGPEYLAHVLECLEQQADLAQVVANGLVEVEKCQNLN